MPVQVVDVAISLQTKGVTRKGFGTPLFIGAHRWFNEPMKSYSSLAAVGADCPTDSQEYKAAQAVFGQTPSVSVFKIGRRECSITLDFETSPSSGDEYSITIKDTDGDTVTASYTAGVSDDEEAVVDAIKGLIDADANVSNHVTTSKTGTGSTAVLTITTASASDTFGVSALSGFIYSYTASDTGAAVYAKMIDYDPDFYFVTAHDHTESFVLSLAASVNATARLYFLSSQATNILTALADPPTDTFGKLRDSNYMRVVGLQYHTADTTYPELAWIGKCAPDTPGTITWAHKELSGVGVSSNPSTGVNLSDTEIDYVLSREANLTHNLGGTPATWEGTTFSGNFIDEIRIVDFLTARITEAYQAKFLNTKKVPYTESGINAMRGVLSSVLDRYITTDAQPNILDENNPYTLSFPQAGDVPFNDKAARELSCSFVANLAGAIHIIKVTGVLTLNAAA